MDCQPAEQVADPIGEMLLADTFSIETLLKHAASNSISLTDLRNLLVKHQQSFNQTSLDLFNNSYDRFFKLSHIITCLAEPIQGVLQPLQNFHNQLNAVCHNHDNYLHEIDRKLAALEETSKNKLLASRLIALVKRRDRIFLQLNRVEWLKQTSVEGIFSGAKLTEADELEQKINCDVIERSFVELYYIYCETRATQPTNDELIPIKKLLESSLEEQQAKLNGWFREVFDEAIQEQNRPLLDFVLRALQQTGNFGELRDYFDKRSDEMLKSFEGVLCQQPLSELPPAASGSSEEVLGGNSQFKLKVCKNLYELTTKCWSSEIYIEALDFEFTKVVCQLLERFAEWLGKLRLSDFRIVGTISAPTTEGGAGSRTTNFLAKQDAIMRLLIGDCNKLIDLIQTFEQTNLPQTELSSTRKDSLQNGFEIVRAGLNNVRNLQHLLER